MRRTLPGHKLISEGAAFRRDADGITQVRTGVSGVGRALCKCGTLSEELASGAARRAWHATHKKHVLADAVPLEVARAMYTQAALRDEELGREILRVERRLHDAMERSSAASADLARQRMDLLRRGVPEEELLSGRELTLRRAVDQFDAGISIGQVVITKSGQWRRLTDGSWRHEETNRIISTRRLITDSYNELEDAA